jgi:glucokinase
VALTAGVDMGGTKIQTAIVRAGKSIGEVRVSTPLEGAASVVEAVLGTIDEAAAAAGINPAELAGIGIGFPGIYDQETGDTLSAPNLVGFDKRYPLGSRVSKKLGGVPVIFDNDVRAAIVGEQRAGAGRPFQDFLGVFVGTGVGGGVVLGGKMRRGRGAAGEIGHTVVKDGGRRCGCGRQGCLEAYAGRGRIEATARKLVEKGESTILFDLLAQKGRHRLTSGVIATALKQGDAMTRMLIDEAVWALGISMASAQNLLDFEAIIIGGGLGDRLGQPFIDRVGQSMLPHLLLDKRPPKMLGTELGDLSGAIGAALLAADAKRTARSVAGSSAG